VRRLAGKMWKVGEVKEEVGGRKRGVRGSGGESDRTEVVMNEGIRAGRDEVGGL